MGLADKVAAALTTIDYQARECMDSGRRRLHHDGKDYCLLSGKDNQVYCPLQGESDKQLCGCLLKEYLKEIAGMRRSC